MDTEEIPQGVRLLLEEQEQRFEERLREQQAEICRLRRSLEDAQASTGTDTPPESTRIGVDPSGGTRSGRSRRQILRAGAVAAGAGLAGAGVVSRPAIAANGDPLVVGNISNSATGNTRFTSSASRALEVNSTGGQNSTSLRVNSDPDPGESNTFAVVARALGPRGTALWTASNHCHLHFNAAGTPPPTRTVQHFTGDITFDSNDDLWICLLGGIPGTWQKLGGPATAGAFHPIEPQRAYDSRLPTPLFGKLSVGENRVVSVADGRDLATGLVDAADIVPGGATAVTYNLACSQTEGAGFVTLTPGDATDFSAASINWTAAGLDISNAGVVKLNDSRQVKAFCGGGATHFIVDITGFFR